MLASSKNGELIIIYLFLNLLLLAYDYSVEKYIFNRYFNQL